MPDQTLLAVVLAAGASSRFGSPKFKAVLPEGKTMLQRAVEQAASVDPKKIVVISGAWTIHKSNQPIPFEVVHHAEWAFGMDATVHFAAQQLIQFPEAGAVLLLPCDMPFLPLAHLKKMKEAVLIRRKMWSATGYEKASPGIPLVWSRSFCQKVLADPSIRPRQYMALHQAEGEVVFTPGDFSDIDRPEDLPRV